MKSEEECLGGGGEILKLMHILFLYFFLFFYDGLQRDIDFIHQVLSLFRKETSLQKNSSKSTISIHLLERAKVCHIQAIFPFNVIHFNEGMKCLALHLKPN